MVSALLAFAQANPTKTDDGGAPRFTPIAAANRLVATDGFAFLIAVLFDEGIPAERAFEAPYLLRQRLGHLDPARIVADPTAVREAIATRPMLHRFVRPATNWVVEGARRVQDVYGGDAARIWRDAPTTARAVQERFDAFTGIAEKKAALAIELLTHELRVPITDLEGADVPYDIHVRRVFLRAGLARRDDLSDVVGAGRALHPQEPGALGMAAWRVGRRWCHAGAPRCSECAIVTVCPRLIEKAAGVTGA